MMTHEAVRAKIAELKELKNMKSEIEKMIEDAENELKAEMTERKQEEAIFGEFKIVWKPVVSQRVDTTAFKKAVPELAERFMVASVSRPFKIY